MQSRYLLSRSTKVKMKYLCVLFALSILISAVYAAPTKSENQKSVKLQGWWPIMKHLAPLVLNHGSEKSFQEKAAVEVQDIDRYLGALKGALDSYLNYNGDVEVQRLPWGTIIKTFGPLLADQISSHGTAESFNDNVVELQGLSGLTGKFAGTLGPMIYDYLSNHHSLLKKLKNVALEQDGDIMAAIESLPEKEKAQAQFLFSVPTALGVGSLAYDLLKG